MEFRVSVSMACGYCFRVAPVVVIGLLWGSIGIKAGSEC